MREEKEEEHSWPRCDGKHLRRGEEGSSLGLVTGPVGGKRRRRREEHSWPRRCQRACEKEKRDLSGPRYAWKGRREGEGRSTLSLFLA